MADFDEVLSRFRRSGRFLDLYFCKRCGASVAYSYLEAHDAWHGSDMSAELEAIAELLQVIPSMARQEVANRQMEACRRIAKLIRAEADRRKPLTD